MFRYLPVRKIQARQVLDSRGNPTVEVEVTRRRNCWYKWIYSESDSAVRCIDREI